jgi:hypothetical protein
MPLPPLPENNTDRAWLKYTSGGVTHEMEFRMPSTTTQAQFVTTATAIANGLKNYMPTADSFTGLRHSDSGSILSFPLVFTAIAGTNATSWELEDKAHFVALSGRSLDGYRSKITFFSVYADDNKQFRSPAPGLLAAAALYSTITGLSPSLCSVSGQDMVWNGYINQGYNSYWQRQLRT